MVVGSHLYTGVRQAFSGADAMANDDPDGEHRADPIA
jgi:hypothetical protein